MNEIISSEFGGSVFQFDSHGWFDATGAALSYGKRPVKWLELPESKKYIDALCRRYKVRKSDFVKTSRGGSQKDRGTWLHPKLAVSFARWLDIDFSIWCDEQIDAIIRGEPTRQFCVWKELQSVVAEDEMSLAGASYGSSLMLKRKKVKAAYEKRIAALKEELQISLFIESRHAS